MEQKMRLLRFCTSTSELCRLDFRRCKAELTVGMSGRRSVRTAQSAGAAVLAVQNPHSDRRYVVSCNVIVD